ncbi:cell wall-binding repeat-containing protein [Clostridium sp. BSD9I1]|uniref:cell wall-binding repeat-containing protein n=1 Tax=Clostridium sp. BSD9I1 TaxID=2003589 RepID=UPI001FA85210|nr:cell wall-binding repeat-containing protein [Clostridium sp. BSD9I1]
MVSGQYFPDALGGAAYVAKRSAPMFLVSPQVNKATEDYIYGFYQLGSPMGNFVILGGTGMVPDYVAQRIITKKRPTNKKVTLGMTIDEVLEIMGKPVDKDEPSRDTYRYYYIFEEVIKAMGPTTEIHPNFVDFGKTLKYKDSYVEIDKDGEIKET